MSIVKVNDYAGNFRDIEFTKQFQPLVTGKDLISIPKMSDDKILHKAELLDTGPKALQHRFIGLVHVPSGFL
jgi:hypothetical protein